MKQPKWMSDRLLEAIFYSNIFYGICAVAQSIEATLQQRFPLNEWTYYFLVCCATVLYYNYPYARKRTLTQTDPRTAWYIKHHYLLRWSQTVLSIILGISLLVFVWHESLRIEQMSMLHWILLLIFPIVAGLYYGINMLSYQYNLRSIGWLKPFIIGFTWAGLVVVYPVLYHCILNEQEYVFTLFGCLLFLKNMMFISVLCIMFDIKDYATDYSSGLRTFVVRIGLRKTIFYILFPLPVLGLLTFMTYAITHQFHLMKIVLNMVPFILLLMVAASLRKRKSLMYYLMVIDGLMLVKAVCGITAMLLF